MMGLDSPVAGGSNAMFCAWDMTSQEGFEDYTDQQLGSLKAVMAQQGTLISSVCPVTCGTCPGSELNEDGRAETVEPYFSECDQPCNGDDTQVCGGGGRNSVYELIDGGVEWSDWRSVGADGTISCRDSTFDISSRGFRSQCQCQGQGFCAWERRECTCVNADGTPTGQGGSKWFPNTVARIHKRVAVRRDSHG